jgi:hypothetical protein
VETFTKMRTNERNLALWERKLALKERELDLREKQLEAAKETVEDTELSPEEQAERLRQIFKISANDETEAPTNGHHNYSSDETEGFQNRPRALRMTAESP